MCNLFLYYPIERFKVRLGNDLNLHGQSQAPVKIAYVNPHLWQPKYQSFLSSAASVNTNHHGYNES